MHFITHNICQKSERRRVEQYKSLGIRLNRIDDKHCDIVGIIWEQAWENSTGMEYYNDILWIIIK